MANGMSVTDAQAPLVKEHQWWWRALTSQARSQSKMETLDELRRLHMVEKKKKNSCGAKHR
jgi:hypothetical protein